MQVNIAMNEDSKEQAAYLRAAYFPDKTSRQIRDSFIFDQCIVQFNDDIKVLQTYITRELPCTTSQRMLSLKAESYERLKCIAAALNVSVAATFRAIIAYSVEHIDGKTNITGNEMNSETAEITQTLTVKITALEKQLTECTQSIAEIKALMYLLQK